MAAGIYFLTIDGRISGSRLSLHRSRGLHPSIFTRIYQVKKADAASFGLRLLYVYDKAGKERMGYCTAVGKYFRFWWDLDTKPSYGHIRDGIVRIVYAGVDAGYPMELPFASWEFDFARFPFSNSYKEYCKRTAL